MTENALNVFVDKLAEKTAQAITVDDGDYKGEDGLLYCGKCHTQKQTIVEFFGERKKAMCLCQCATQRRDAAIAEHRKMERLRQIMQMRTDGFPEREMQNWNFANDDGANPKATNIAKRYVENFDTMRERGKGLVFYGNVGTGKTFYAACIANALIDSGRPCLVTNFVRLANELNANFDRRQEFLDGLNRYDLLVIDDLAAERDTEYMSEIVQTVIDSRYRAKLPTIITTNLTAEELKNPAEIRRQRTYSRLLEMCLPVEITGKDRRRARLVHDYAEFNELLGLSQEDAKEAAK